jgi:DNA-binding response OmpR family regulator
MGGYVLIVESDPDLQKRIGDALKDARYELASEAEVGWARRSVAVRAPDAVVVDTVLSDGDGFKLAEELRRDPDTRDTPIFFVASRYRGASHRTEARRRFAPAEYLPAPLDVNSLLALILEAVPPAGGVVRPPSGDRTPAPDVAGAGAAEAPVAMAAEPSTAATAALTSMATPAPAVAASRRPARGATPRPVATAAALADPVQQRERREVERNARTLTAERAELTGTLARVPFARLVQGLYTRRASGSLLLLRDKTKKIVSFSDGFPVSVRSNVLGECLGQILLGQKLISPETLAESLSRMRTEKRHQGEILVAMGALSPFNLQRALVEQVEAKLFEIFSWREGQFMFKAGDAPPKEALRLSRAPAALILEGIRRHYDLARQTAVLQPFLGRFVTLSPDPMLRLQEMTSDPGEQSFIAEIDGSRRFEALLDRGELPRDKARVLLAALAEAGMITAAEQPVRRRGATPTPLVEIGDTDVEALAGGPATPPPAGRPGGDDPAVEAVDDSGGGGDLTSDATFGSTPGVMPLDTGQLSMVAQTVRTQDYFWALGVERKASDEAIDQAYEALARTFHADRYRHSPEEDRKLAQEIFERLAEAHQVLRDPARREVYVAKIDGTSDGAAAAEPSDADGAAAGSFDGRPGASPGARPARGAQVAAADEAAATSAGNAAARALYDAGMEHLRARRHHEAVEAFRQAARLVPGEAEFRAALGWSLFREAPADARAGRAALAELRRATQIDAGNRRALHYLASFYAETGQPDRAIKELEKLLTLDPTSIDVADQLRRLRDRS